MNTDLPAAAPPPPPAEPLGRRIWRHPLTALVTGLATFAATAALASFAVRYLPEGPVAAIVGTLLTIGLLFAAYKLVIRRLGRHRHDDLPLRGALRDSMAGVALAAVLMSAIVGVAALAGVYRIVGPGTTSDAVELVFQAGLFAAFVEEVLFRGILFRWVEEWAGSIVAMAVSALAFGAAHLANDNASWLAALAIALEAGLMLGAAYMLTRSLWLAIGIHFGWNVVQGLVWDVPVSGFPLRGLVDARLEGPDLLTGGAFGLEASVIAMVLAGATGAWLLTRAVRAGQLIPLGGLRRVSPASG